MKLNKKECIRHWNEKKLFWFLKEVQITFWESLVNIIIIHIMLLNYVKKVFIGFSNSIYHNYIFFCVDLN